MRKVIKNVVKTVVATLCGLLLAVLVAPLAVSLLVSIPAVQNAVVQRLMTYFSEKLGTKVSIDRVDIKLINHIEVEGFYVEDFGGDTLMYVPRLEAPIVELGLAGEPLTFGKVHLTGAQLWLRKAHTDDEMNISRVVDSIRAGRPSNPDSRFRMRIMGIEADSLTFGLFRGDRKRRDAGVDFSRFIMWNIRADIDDFAIAGDTVRMEINSLEGTERSGLHIENLSAHPLVVSRGAVTLDNVNLLSRGSVLRLPSIRLLSAERVWSNFGEFTDSVSMGITMRSSRVTTDLVGAFVPAVADWGIVLDGVSLHTRGILDGLAGAVESARTLGSSFSFDFTSRGLPHPKEALLDIRLTGLDTSGEDIDSLLHSVTGSEPSGRLPAILGRLGPVGLTGEIVGRLSDFTASGTLNTLVGNVDLAAKIKVDSVGTILDGGFSTARLEAGRLLSVESLGSVGGVFTATGTLGEEIRGAVHGDIDRLEFRDYAYSGLDFDGTVYGRKYGMELSARDPALVADLSALIDRSGQTPEYTVNLDLEKADLAAMNLDIEDSVSMVSGRLVAKMSGAGFDDANGTVDLRDATYLYDGGAVSTSLATLTAQNGVAGKHVILHSEFADGEFHSRTGYRDMLLYLKEFLQRYISLPGLSSSSSAFEPETEPGVAVVAPPDGGDPAAGTNYSIITFDVKNTEKLMEALAPAAAIADSTKFLFMFNPYTGSFSLSARSRFIEYGGILAENISLTADNAADSLTMYLSGTDVYTGRGHFSRLELHGGAKGRQRLDVSLDGKVWRITSDSLYFGSGRVGLDNVNVFAAESPGRRLTASGVISSLPSDTLHVRFNRFDLSPFGGFLSRGGRLDLAGIATGWLDISGAMKNPGIDADVEIRNLSVKGHTAPPLRFVSRPESGGGVRYRLENENTGSDLVVGTLSPRGEIAAEVKIDSLNVALLDPLLGDILEDTRGRGSARLTLNGTFKNLRAGGHIDLSAFETTVGYTRARYSVEGARLAVENSVLKLPRTPVNSTLGGTGDISMNVDFSNFRDIRTEIDARTSGMLAFDTGPGDSEAFYGRVFATGTVGIRSGRMGTRMDISARTETGTQFHLPLNAKSNVSWADFVVFSDRRQRPDTTDVLARKRLAYERRLAGGTGPARRAKPLELNLTVGVTPAAELHLLIDPNLGQGITGRGEGVIDMRINPASDLLTMTGDYNISSGRFEFSMMDVFNKTFEIAPGSTLRWSGAADDALLSVDASYRVRTSLRPLIAGSALVSGRSVPVDCVIRLRDRLSEPDITFDISLPSADAEARQIVANAMNTGELKSMQFLSLLTTGSFASDNSITGQTADAGVMATGAVGFDILTNQLNNFLSSDDYDIYFRYRPQDNFSTSQFDMGFSTRLWNDRLQLEVEGNYVDDRAATSVGTNNAANLAGDVSLTWVIDRAGNLRLKVFSQTIDRLNEDQGRQENGLGIYYRKDFDTFGDIFSRNNSKFAADSVIVKTPRGRRREAKRNEETN